MLGVPAGIILSNMLYGNFYDDELRASMVTTGNGTATTCYGPSCYRKAFQVSAGIQLVPVLLSVGLFGYRSRMMQSEATAPLLLVSTVVVGSAAGPSAVEPPPPPESLSFQ